MVMETEGIYIWASFRLVLDSDWVKILSRDPEINEKKRIFTKQC